MFLRNTRLILQPIEALSSTEKSLKVPLRGTFKLFSGFHVSAKRCIRKLSFPQCSRNKIKPRNFLKSLLI